MRTFMSSLQASPRAASAAAMGWNRMGQGLVPNAPPMAGRLQAKRTVNAPGDRDEQEADRWADQVMRAPGAARPRPSDLPAPTGLQMHRAQTHDTGACAAPQLVEEAVRMPGQPLSPATRAWMEPRFGHDFSRVRVHADGVAAQSARAVQAHAYTLGRDIVFAAGRYAPGTHDGLHLIAHELTHVVQQAGGLGHPDRAQPQRVQRQPARYYEQSEAEVADAVIDALQQSNHIAGLNVDPAFELLNAHPLPFQMRVLADLHAKSYFDGFLGYLAPGTKASTSLIVAIRFTQCEKAPEFLAYEDILEAQRFLDRDLRVPPELKPAVECLERERVRHEKRRAEERRQRERQKDDARFDAVFEPGSDFCALKKGVMKWQLYTPTSAGDVGKKQRMQIRFLPDAPYRNKTVTFLQTLREEGGSGRQTTIDIGVNASVFRPFYGVNWNNKARQWVPSNEGTDVGFRSQPNSTEDPSAYLFDEPYFFPPPHGRVFESVAVVLETGETLGALTWGVGVVPTYAQKPTCSDSPSAEYGGAVKTFYTAKDPAPAQGGENYDLLFDRFSPNDARLSAAQKKQLDAVAVATKALVAQRGAKETGGVLVVGGFGDAMDADAMAASELRARTVAEHLAGQGVAQDTLDVRPFGANWARYELGTKDAKEGGNRRVQVRLFR